ncbi:signal peptidase I [Dietzia sp. B32]|uniref:signal peptidase I n=1 Tax=Dietzia sp. B32 TaxID=2915130 RepID=UPI0021ADA8BB|nr:signal peptidase I [Dietzia sp. B32]UVE96629.1 signal peptidase I [Dietzia sp. B32]
MTEQDTSSSAHRGAGAPPAGGDGTTTVLWWLRTIGGWLLLLVFGFILVVMVVVPRATGAQAYTVLTGSMEPEISPGALVVVRPTPAHELRTDDVITFQPYSGNPAVVTHRITGIFYDGVGRMRLYTQGDANNTPDDWALLPEQVRGVMWYSVPQLGRLNVLLTGESRAVAITIVAGGLIVYAVLMIGGGLRDGSREKRAARAELDKGEGTRDGREGAGDE